MNPTDLKEHYRLDELLHPEGKPWEWWERNGPDCHNWETMPWPPAWYEDVEYRRKDTAPDWSAELSPKELDECKDWPEGYSYSPTSGNIYYIGFYVWNKEQGWACTERIKKLLLAHFQKRRLRTLEKQEITKEKSMTTLIAKECIAARDKFFSNLPPEQNTTMARQFYYHGYMDAKNA